MIVNNGTENISQILPSQSAAAPAPGKTSGVVPAEASESDSAQVSSVGTQVAQSAGASDVRLDKVAGIQAALQAGTYQVPASAVAQKVIGALLSHS